mmetsp:Transcript_28335/g.58009  ORF Transcript_28335/g.58009 Transcript_28335/m.58009 type:complete len:220 (+) Transcript_28335:771-1430(+)
MVDAKSFGQFVYLFSPGCFWQFLFEKDHEFVVWCVFILFALLLSLLPILAKISIPTFPTNTQIISTHLLHFHRHHLTLFHNVTISTTTLPLRHRSRPSNPTILPLIPLLLLLYILGRNPQYSRGIGGQQIGHIAIKRPGLLIVKRSQTRTRLWVIRVVVAFRPEFDALTVRGSFPIARFFLGRKGGNIQVQCFRKGFYRFGERVHQGFGIFEAFLASVR